MERQELSSLLEFWNDLSPARQDLLVQVHQVRRYERGSIIHARDNECMGLIRILKGTAKTFMLSPEGRKVILYRMFPGNVDVLSAACVISQIRFRTQIIAETDCEILVIPAVYLADLKQTSLPVRCYIYERLAARFSDTVLVMQDMLFLRMDQRIAALFVRQADRSGTTEIRMTHEEIASRLNSSREVISRILKDMEKQELILLKRGRIQILDPDALRDLSPE